jgi:uncharacterized protein
VFAAANEYRMPIVVHMRPSVTEKLPYGRDEALVFLNELVPAAPDVPIQIAHLAGAGGYSDPGVDQALEVFVDAIARNDPRTRQLWFDISGVALGNPSAVQTNLVATRIRQLRINRVLYGTDTPQHAARSMGSLHASSSQRRRDPSNRVEYCAVLALRKSLS